MDKQTNLIWVDLEMTGLNPDTDRILEIATVVTDKDLNVLAEGPTLVVHQSDALLDGMDEWCTTHHGQSGLTQRVKDSSLTEAEVEQQTLDFLNDWVPPGASPLCGNSIWQDRRFLIRYMPKLDSYCHYRNIDVSTLKELARRWRPEVLGGVKKKGSHRALDDILDSINELRHYRDTLLKL